MADPIFDKEGNLTNLEELSTEEVATAYQEKNRMLFGRVTEEETKRKQAEADKAKAEADLKVELEKNKPPVKEPVKEVPPQNFITKDEYQEGILRTSKGYTDEDITVLNVVAKGKGITLFQAEQDEMFKQHLERKAEEEKKAKAQLGASKGSNAIGKKEAPKTREEHVEMWKEKLGR